MVVAAVTIQSRLQFARCIWVQNVCNLNNRTVLRPCKHTQYKKHAHRQHSNQEMRASSQQEGEQNMFSEDCIVVVIVIVGLSYLLFLNADTGTAPAPMLTAEEGDIVALHWSCVNEAGEELDSSRASDDPTTFEVGAGNIVGNRLFEAFDEAVRGMTLGESAVIKVSYSVEFPSEIINSNFHVYHFVFAASRRSLAARIAIYYSTHTRRDCTAGRKV